MDATTNSINWLEIPAIDIKRSKTFYETIFGFTMDEMDMMGMKMAFFPATPNSGKVSGGVCESPMHKPSADGPVIYLNANPNMDPVIEKIDGAGGKVVMPKTKLPNDFGYMAFFMDTEGNKIGLHSQG
jgi:predicted enzyme related to lactoylglutathione lyase